MGNYFIRAVCHERRQKISIEHLAEYHKWQYRHTKYRRSLVSVAVNWLTILPSQDTVIRPENGSGSWVGTHVVFVGDDTGYTPQQDFPWNPESFFMDTRIYEDITIQTLVGLCESADGEQFADWIAEICIENRRRNANLLKQLVLDLLSSHKCSALMTALNQRLGAGALQILSQEKEEAEQGVAPNRSLPPTLNSTSSVRGSEDF